MNGLLKQMMAPIVDGRLGLAPLAFAAALTSLPALAHEMPQAAAPAAAAQAEHLPAGFTQKSATVNGVGLATKSAARDRPLSCSMAMPRPATCGCP